MCISAAPPPTFFSGSYRPDDVRILLKPLALNTVSIAEKEQLLQTGQYHYSELLSPETLPSPRYLEIFYHTFALMQQRLAHNIIDLAALIAAQHAHTITLVSLLRAGTPIGVLLKHVLTNYFARSVVHYSVSILRDRGIDNNALRFIVQTEAQNAASIVFVDGWISKGMIARTLTQSVTAFNQEYHTTVDTRLFALTDLAGAGVAPSDEDNLIPSCILNATISGLVSRSVCNQHINTNDFHSCLFYQQFAAHDISIWFIDTMLATIHTCLHEGYLPQATPVASPPARDRSQQLLATMKAQFGGNNEHLIKFGIGESTRVLLRRVPERLIVRDPTAPDVAHLLQLAQEKQVPWQINPTLPYQAVSLIQGFTAC
ncbi:hypothetical protein CKO12_08420 [Chromatium okenii]|uniref:cysteine protease StiP family protein n=1 Tax=Chromatium okenii TaxID=61644 RepID=UPI001906A12F|nr:cysteine protease StiP family protein [Chromatium okenii]MBK1641894.1 hypothetical protein [Chromatium okenii]